MSRFGGILVWWVSSGGIAGLIDEADSRPMPTQRGDARPAIDNQMVDNAGRQSYRIQRTS